jgi:hypothetical protein|tara:strand:+ start:103 stop:312 length:210 start_codon:yes stop_codon:yes gene_type:complete
MTHWHCERRGYLPNAVHPNKPAVDTWKTDHPISYILNGTALFHNASTEMPSVLSPIDELNSVSKEASKL